MNLVRERQETTEISESIEKAKKSLVLQPLPGRASWRATTAQGFAKSAHPWLCSLCSSGAEHPRPDGA